MTPSDAEDRRPPGSTPPAEAGGVAVEGLVKTFGSVRANDGIDLTFTRGEIHALVGENGAGKSTLVKILAGIYQPDSGSITLDGHPVEIHSPVTARELGIAVVHQHSTLIPALTVLENVDLVEGGLGGIGARSGELIAAKAESLGFEIDPNSRVESLTVGQRQRVEIARALIHDAQIVLLDEPTTVLAPSEQAELFALLREIKATGTGVVLVTHRLDEATGHCDRLTALRHGRVTGESDAPAELEQRTLVRMLVGEVEHYSRESRPTGDAVLEVRALSGSPHEGGVALEDVSLHVGAGEVLGVAGVEGNGQRELAAALVGSWKPEIGSVLLDGREISDYPAPERTALIADVPDDESLAVVLSMPVWQNLALGSLAWSEAPTPGARRAQRQQAVRLVEEFGIRTPDVETRLSQLSGGNRRRVILARELSKDPRLVVASYASKGLDVRSIEQVKIWIDRLATSGAAVVYIAAELEDLLDLSDRIAVLARGAVTGEMPVATADVDEIGRLMLIDRRAVPTEAA